MNGQKVTIVFRYKPQPSQVFEFVFAEPGIDIEHGQVFTVMPVPPEAAAPVVAPASEAPQPMIELNTSNVTFKSID